MARAPELPKTDHDGLWDYVPGEVPDGATNQALNLAHRAAEKFPDLTKRYRGYAGPVAIVSGALIAMAGVAVARRMRRGQKPEEILEQITSEEIEQAATVSSRQNRWWRLVGRVARLRRKNAAAADEDAEAATDESREDPADGDTQAPL